ncbi:unnamed protein product [Prunus brigantina]
MPDEIKMQVRGQLSTNYNLEDLDEESLMYVNRLFGERYKQWKSDLHHHFEAFDDPQVALQEGCPKELEGREDSWAGGSKFPEIDVFGDVYVRPGNELAESLHTTMVERSQLVLHESASQLPPETPIESVDPPQDAGFQILTQTLDQTLGRRPGTYCRGIGNARQREPRPLSSSQANSQSLARFGIPIPNFGAPTSEPVQPKHPQQTTAPVDAQTSEVHVADDQVDFGTLFD